MKLRVGLFLMMGLVVLLSNCSTPAAPVVVATATTAPMATTVPTTTLVSTATTIPTATMATPTIKPPTSTPAAAQPAKNASITLTWYGHASFVLGTSTGLKALLDPTTEVTNYKIPKMTNMDLVTASHEHTDHNATDLADGDPIVVLRGLGLDGWAKIDQTIKGVRVQTVGVFHDDTQGTQRGKNAIFVFDVDGLRMAHLGDLGHVLSTEQIKEIGIVDVLLIPVGGFYTIDAKKAAEVVNQLNPKIIVPMHYKTADLAPSLASVLAPVDDFIKAMGDQVKVVQTGQTITIEKDKLPATRTMMVMKYKP